MCDPLPLGEKILLFIQKIAKIVVAKVKNNPALFAAVMLLVFGLMMRFLGSQSIQYAQAYSVKPEASQNVLNSPLFGQDNGIFDENVDKSDQTFFSSVKKQIRQQLPSDIFAQKIYALVGQAPIRQMVPFISKRSSKTAAFLVGIAKKESSFGLASPSKDGKDCYNYWGYKGVGGQGESMGYACFASAEEAVDIVGDRIQTLVEKNRSTPEAMVDTWKCGTSCTNDPGAPSWVSTVALYFNKIVS